MKKGTMEFYEIMAAFEKETKNLFYGHKVERVGREEKVPPDQFYNDGFVNVLFKAFMSGYEYRRNITNLEET